MDPTAENMVTEGRVDFPFEQARAADDEPEAGELLLLSRMLVTTRNSPPPSNLPCLVQRPRYMEAFLSQRQ